MLDALRQRGALFRPDLATLTGRLPYEVDEALWDGVARGLVTADGFRAVRSLLRRGGPARYAPTRGLRRGLRAQHRWPVRPLVAAARAGRRAPTGTSWPRPWPSSWPPGGAWCSGTSLARESLAVPWRDLLWAFRPHGGAGHDPRRPVRDPASAASSTRTRMRSTC